MDLTAAELRTELLRLLDETFAEGAEKLPPERELAERFGASRGAVRRVLAEFESEGLVYRVLGRAGGAYLTRVRDSDVLPSDLFLTRRHKLVRELNEVKGVPQMLEEQGFAHETRSLFEGIAAVDDADVCERLGVPVGTELFSLLRVRLADGAPISLERMYVDPTRFPDIEQHSPISSLYRLLRDSYGLVPHSTHETIESVAASRNVAKILGVRQGEPVFLLRRVGFAAGDDPFEVSIDFFRGDRTRLSVVTQTGLA